MTALLLLAALGAGSPDDFRVRPYLLAPHRNGITITWYTTEPTPGEFALLDRAGKPSRQIKTRPVLKDALEYSELELQERSKFPDMFENRNYQHQVVLDRLEPDTRYEYRVTQGKTTLERSFRTAPPATGSRPIRFTVFADSETDPEGRTIYREWQTGAQHPESTGRPEGQARYLVTETVGFQENLKVIRQRQPEFLVLAGDIVQGGGYQRAWDEFFFHTAGKFDDPLSSIPLVPAIGNWENFGARNGEYSPTAIYNARTKYATYFPGPSNGTSRFKGFYYRVDYGPITLITLDSSNGLPDNTDNDTNKNIDAATYPGDNLVDLTPGAEQWQWTLRELADARSKGQIIFVQFHHIPYSSGGHSLPLTVAGSSGQSGLPMRAYTPYFQKYGVTAVFCGHNESFERSEVAGIQFYDAGVAGDGLGFAIDKVDPRRLNPWRKWVAHHDSAEQWRGKQLIDGGKHYGHLEVEVTPHWDRFDVTFTPVYIFPVTDATGKVIRSERRVYADVVKVSAPRRS